MEERLRPRFKPFALIANTVRVKEIAVVLVKRGFAEVLDTAGFPRAWITSFSEDESNNASVYERIRLMLEDLGPTFVKFGQILSSRPDLLPEPLIQEFRRLRKQVREVPFSEIRPRLEVELGSKIEVIFSEFEPNAVACGSIGQVYRARLRETGDPVAVKVRRPGIRQAIRSDIEILGWMARRLHSTVPELRPFDLPDIVAATGEGIMEELDFSIEAANAAIFNHLNPFPHEVFAPHVYEHFSTSGLTVSEWIDGTYPDDPSIEAEEGKRLARAGGRSVFHQIVISGFFHADPHSGNLIITADGRGCLIDWGLAGQLTRQMRYALADLFQAISTGDSEKVARVAIRLGSRKQRVDRNLLEKQVATIMRHYGARLDRGERLGRIVLDLIYVFGSNGIRLARDFSLLAKAVIATEEVGHTLDPDFDIRAVAEPFLNKLARERMSPSTLLRSAGYDIADNFRTIVDLPGDFQRVLRRIEDGDATVNLRHEGLEETADEFASGVNRLVLAVITGALIIGSSFITASTVDSQTTFAELFRLPAGFGTVGYLLGAFFGVWTVVDILRHGGHRK